MSNVRVLTVEGVGRRTAQTQRGVGALEEGVRPAARALALAVRLDRRASAHHHLLVAFLVLILVLYYYISYSFKILKLYIHRCLHHTNLILLKSMWHSTINSILQWLSRTRSLIHKLRETCKHKQHR